MKLHVYQSDPTGERAWKDHVVMQVRDDRELVSRAVTFFHEKRQAGAGIVLCTSDGRWREFRAGLQSLGMDVDAGLVEGWLRRLRPNEVIEGVMVDGVPDPDRFDAIIGSNVRGVEELSPEGPVCMYGEVLDQMWFDGEFETARKFLDLWSRLGRGRRMFLVCGQRLDLFVALRKGVPTGALADRQGVALFDEASAGLREAVSTAVRETFGQEEARDLLALSDLVVPPLGLPPGPAHVLFWLRDNLPQCASQIAERARSIVESSDEATPPCEVRIADAPRDVLVVEDDPNDVFLLEYTFARYAPKVKLHVARDGQDAWKRLEEMKKPPAHVLLDLKLPRKSGLELLEEMKRHPVHSAVPVTVHTSSRESADVARAYQLGACAYVVKQADMTRLARGLALLCSVESSTGEARSVA